VPPLLRRDVGLEQPLHHLGRNAPPLSSTVTRAKPSPRALAHRPRATVTARGSPRGVRLRALGAAWHGVGDEVHQHLRELVAVGAEQGEALRAALTP
jgi:hypothetical protein